MAEMRPVRKFAQQAIIVRYAPNFGLSTSLQLTPKAAVFG